MRTEVIETEEVGTTLELVKTSGLPETKIESLLAAFVPSLERIRGFKEQAESIVIADEFDKKNMKAARELRLELKNERTNAEKARKQLKEEVLREGQTIDAVAKIFKNLIEPIESSLEAKEKFAENLAAERRAKLEAERKFELSELNYPVNSFSNLGEMPEEAYQQVLEMARLAEEKRKEQEAATEQAKIEAEMAEALRKEQEREEQERIKAENERLKAERAEKEEADRKAIIERDEKRAKAAKVAVKELSKLGFSETEGGVEIAELNWFVGAKFYSEFDNKEDFNAFIAEKKSTLEAKRQAKIESDKAALLAEELRKEKAREQDRRAAEQKQKAENEAKEKAARLAPDKTKLIEFANKIDNLEIPELTNEEAEKIKIGIRELLSKTSTWIRTKADQL